MANLTDITVMVCVQLYTENNYFGLVLSHSIICLTLLTSLMMGFYFSKKLHYFLVKERAPKLALFQLITFTLTLLLPYTIEIMNIFGLEWDQPGSENIFRKMMKALYSTSRSTCYILFLFRY